MQSFVEYIRAETYQEAIRSDLHCDVASEIAAAVERNIRQSEYGGTTEYIHSVDRVKRNQEIMAEFRGNNHDQLARKWGISRRILEYIVRAHQQRRRVEPEVHASSQSG